MHFTTCSVITSKRENPFVNKITYPFLQITAVRLSDLNIIKTNTRVQVGISQTLKVFEITRNTKRNITKTCFFNPNIWWGGQIDLPCGFLKNVSSVQRVEPRFFVTFNIILKHIFPENFIEFTQVVQKIWRNSLSILAIFINFNQFFRFFNITLLQRN